jgi:hypothetical protein
MGCDSPDAVTDLTDSRVLVTIVADQSVTCDFTNRADPWEPLVRTAAEQFQVDLNTGVGVTRGFYNQILNIVCASARNLDAECDPMSPLYATAQWAGDGWDCTPQRADCWIFNVFQAYLTGDTRYADPAAETLAIEADAQAALKGYCDDAVAAGASLTDPLLGLVGTAVCKYLSKNAFDYAALYAGGMHFLHQLEPNFARMTAAVAEADALSPTPVPTLYRDLQTIRQQHSDFINLAVLPGFDQVYAAGNLTALGKVIAQTTVPFAAQCFREDSVYASLANLYGKKDGANIYEAVTPASVGSLYASKRCKALLKLAGTLGG